ncbi:MAG: phasin family protein [Candidatus Merdivicinus sp.]|jgi:polyhydroxyalkanoate synthesis regulator phasin
MNDLSTELKRIFLAGVGAIAVTAEKSQQMVEELVKKGELTVEQGKVLNEELKRDVSEKVKEAVANIQGTEPVEKIAERVDQMTAEERAILKAKLEEAEAAAEAKTENTAAAECESK